MRTCKTSDQRKVDDRKLGWVVAATQLDVVMAGFEVVAENSPDDQVIDDQMQEIYALIEKLQVDIAEKLK